MKHMTFFAALALGALIAAPGHALTVSHAQGETEIADNPQTVLVFDLASLDTLDALGVTVQGVPSGGLPAYLDRYQGTEIARIGSLFEPDYEAVTAAQPDLIIVGGRSAAKYADLARIAPTIDLTVDRANYIESARQNVETLAEIFGKHAEADAKLTELDASIASLNAAAADAGSVLVILTTSERMSAHGPGSRFGVIYDEFGLTPAVEDLDTGNRGEAITHEFILELNPDWIFVIDRDAAVGRESAAQIIDNELIAQTTAWQNEQVVHLDPVGWYLVGTGLTALKMNVDQITNALSSNE